tara:strand:+ start:2694 stop:5072 length:2379 start_codon:yes stop_codon:yes gene_type:complete
MAMVTVRLGDGRLYSIPEEMLNTMGMSQNMGMMSVDTNDFGLSPTLPYLDAEYGGAETFPLGAEKGDLLSLTPVNNVESQALAKLEEQTRQAKRLQKDRQYSQSMDGAMAGEASGVLTGGADSQVGVESQAGTATSRGQGILDRLLGSELPETYGLLDEQQMQEAQSRARDEGLLNASVALLRAGAPQTTRVGIGEAIASAMQAGRQATGDLYDQRLKQAVFMNELAEKREAKELAIKKEKDRQYVTMLKNSYPKFADLATKTKYLEFARQKALDADVDPTDIDSILMSLNPYKDETDKLQVQELVQKLSPKGIMSEVKDITLLKDEEIRELSPEDQDQLKILVTKYRLAGTEAELRGDNLKQDELQFKGVESSARLVSKEEYAEQIRRLVTGVASEARSEVRDSQPKPQVSEQNKENQTDEIDPTVTQNTSSVLSTQYEKMLEKELPRGDFLEAKKKLIDSFPKDDAMIRATMRRNVKVQDSIRALLDDEESLDLLTTDQSGTIGALFNNLREEAIERFLPNSRLTPKMNKAIAAIQNIIDKVGYQALQQMRADNPTGGAVGQLAVKELLLFQRDLGKLAGIRNKEELKKALNKAQDFLTKQFNQVNQRYVTTYNPNYKAEGGQSWAEYTEEYIRTREGRQNNQADNEQSEKSSETVNELQGLSEKERIAKIKAELQRREELKRRSENNDNENQSRDKAVSLPEQAIIPVQREPTSEPASERTFEPELPTSILRQIAPMLGDDGARRIFNDFLDATNNDVDMALQMFREFINRATRGFINRETSTDDYGLL